MWNDQEQNVFINFPNHFAEIELWPFISTDENKHPQFLKLTETIPEHITMIAFDQKSIQKSSSLPTLERPYAKNTTMITTLFDLNSPSDSVSIPTHNIDPHYSPNHFSNSTLNTNIN